MAASIHIKIDQKLHVEIQFNINIVQMIHGQIHISCFIIEAGGSSYPAAEFDREEKRL